MRNKTVWTAIMAVVCLLTQVHPGFAQGASAGTVSGVVRDSSGAVITGAKVELRVASTVAKHTVTDQRGRFVLEAIPVGEYQLVTKASGFAPATVSAVAVQPASDVSLSVTMKVATAVASVQVDGESLASIASSSIATDFGRQSSHNTAELLAESPGVSLHGNGELATIPFLHGLGDERSKIVVDGMTISSACPNHMNPTLSYVAPEQAAQVTVLAGITPVSLGGDSLGGTISVQSPAPVFSERGGTLKERGNFTSYYRSNGDNWGGSLNEWIASEHFGIGYVGFFTTTDDYADGAGHKVTSTSAQSTDHALTLAAQSGRNLFLAIATFHHTPLEGFVNAYMDMTHNNANSLNLRYRRTLTEGFLEARFYWQNTHHQMNFLQDKLAVYGMGASMPMLTHGRDLGYSVRYESALGARHSFRAGNELHRFRLDDWWPPVAGMAPMMGPNTFVNINNGRRARLGTYAEVFSHWNSRWSTLIGVRNDSVWSDAGNVQGYCNASWTGMMPCSYTADAAAFNAESHAKTDVNVDLTTLARYESNEHAAFEFGYARKNRSPNLYERYTWSTGMMASSMIGWFGDGNMYFGNVALKAETGNLLSGTLQLHGKTPKPWEVKLTPHLNYIQNYIDVNVVPTMGGMSMLPLLRFANHDARIYGADLSSSATLWSSDGAGTGKLSGTGAWLHGTRTDRNTPLYQMMPLNLRLAFDEEVKGLSAGFGAEMVDRKSDLDPSRMELHTPGYALFNLHAAYKSKVLQGAFRVDNLFNRLYELPLGGNNIDIYNATGTMTAVTGRGRSVSVNLTAKF